MVVLGFSSGLVVFCLFPPAVFRPGEFLGGTGGGVPGGGGAGCDYIHNALTRFNLLNANDTKTPLPEGVHLVAANRPMPPEKLTKYQQLIGTLLYASIGTRPDIAFAVTRSSRYNANLTDEHHRYAQYILKYLKGTIGTRTHYDGSSHVGLIGYSDSDWGENKDDRHSTSGQVFSLANGAISWRSRRQKTVALSVAEAEYMELAETAKQAARLRCFSQEIGRSPTHPTTICADNQAAIFLAMNPAQQTRIKHMDIHYHYIREQVENEKVTICHIPGEDNPADLFTKSLG